MTRSRWWRTLPLALLVATSGLASAAEIRDKAGMFSADAISKAQADLDRIEKEYQVPVTIETIETLNGKSIDDVLPQHAKAIDAQGLYILIAHKDHKIQADADSKYARHLTRPRRVAIRDAFEKAFARRDFDGGLALGVEQMRTTFDEARTEAGGSLKPAAAPKVAVPPKARVGGIPGAVGRVGAPGNNSWGASSLIYIVLGILGVLLVFRILGALFSAGRGGGYANQGQMMGRGGPGGYPGPGGPGYGGGYGGAPAGGGGFMSSMFGGIGGALAGNWLYDQFSGGRHHGGGYSDSNVVDPGAAAGGAAASEPAGTEWVGQNDGGGDWGGGTPTGGDGGGDWGGGGGGGGGDWGGGGGGGDWGGGGGGDDGGSW